MTSSGHKGKLFKCDIKGNESVIFWYTGDFDGKSSSLENNIATYWSWSNWDHEHSDLNKQYLVGSSCLAQW
jgi:hypothetical protein